MLFKSISALTCQHKGKSIGNCCKGAQPARRPKGQAISTYGRQLLCICPRSFKYCNHYSVKLVGNSYYAITLNSDIFVIFFVYMHPCAAYWGLLLLQLYKRTRLYSLLRNITERSYWFPKFGLADACCVEPIDCYRILVL